MFSQTSTFFDVCFSKYQFGLWKGGGTQHFFLTIFSVIYYPTFARHLSRSWINCTKYERIRIISSTITSSIVMYYKCTKKKKREWKTLKHLGGNYIWSPPKGHNWDRYYSITFCNILFIISDMDIACNAPVNTSYAITDNVDDLIK